jgi:hypothetical protein
MFRSNRMVAYQTKLAAEPGEELLVRRASLRPKPLDVLETFENELARALEDFEAMRESALHTSDLADYIAYLSQAVGTLARRFAQKQIGSAREDDRTSLRGRSLE